MFTDRYIYSLTVLRTSASLLLNVHFPVEGSCQ